MGMLLVELKETFFTSLLEGLLLKSMICVAFVVLVVIIIGILLVKILYWLVLTHWIIIDWLHDFLLLCFTCKANKWIIWVNNLFDRF